MNTHPQGPVFNDLLTGMASWLLAGCVVWATLIGGAALLEAATGGRLRAMSWVGCPPSVRRALLAGLGVALVTTPAQVTTATASAAPVGSAARSQRFSPEHSLPVPARPLGSALSGQRIVVRPGDSLWHLASSRLPPSAALAEVCDLVERLHRRNREVIGPDPNLIRPGQRLSTPRHLEEKP
ncbi:MAG: LysM domain-containing protein [Marmoricola sp.]